MKPTRAAHLVFRSGPGAGLLASSGAQPGAAPSTAFLFAAAALLRPALPSSASSSASASAGAAKLSPRAQEKQACRGQQHAQAEQVGMGTTHAAAEVSMAARRLLDRSSAWSASFADWLFPPHHGRPGSSSRPAFAMELPTGTLPAPQGASSSSPASLLRELLEPILRAVPKKKVSHSRKSMRSANKGLKDRVDIVHCPGCGRPKLHHHLCAHCYSDINRRQKAELRQNAEQAQVQQPPVAAPPVANASSASPSEGA